MFKNLLPCAVATMLVAASLHAQCVAPTGTQSVATTFNGTTYLGTVNATFGSNLFFNLTCNTSITINSMAIDLLR